jgi:hypothetical protein
LSGIYLYQWLREAFEQWQISDYEFMTGINDADVMNMKGKAENFLMRTKEFLEHKGVI